MIKEMGSHNCALVFRRLVAAAVCLREVGTGGIGVVASMPFSLTFRATFREATASIFSTSPHCPACGSAAHHCEYLSLLVCIHMHEIRS